jgi:hypothetical protein
LTLWAVQNDQTAFQPSFVLKLDDGVLSLEQEQSLYPKNGSWNAEKPFVLSYVEA